MAKPRRQPARRQPRSPSTSPASRPPAQVVDIEDGLAADGTGADNMGSMMEMDAFDQLPAAVRAALRATPYGCPAEMLLEQLLMGHSEQQLLTFLETWASRSRREAIALGTPPELTAWPALPGNRRAARGRRR